MFHRSDQLLENWPQHRDESLRSIKRPLSSSFKWSSTSPRAAVKPRKKKTHQVQFSESSQLHLYERPPISLLQSLSYTLEDRDEFGMDALQDGRRIKNLIAAAPPSSAAESLKFLLQENIISRDELIGIDHFILGKPTRVAKTRKHHAAVVLRKQQEQRHQHQKLEDAALTLGKFAEQSSHKSTQNALVRAAMAA